MDVEEPRVITEPIGAVGNQASARRQVKATASRVAGEIKDKGQDAGAGQTVYAGRDLARLCKCSLKPGVMRRRFDAIIADMTRPGDRQADCALPSALLQAGVGAPLGICSGDESGPDRRPTARQKGASASGRYAHEHFELVREAVT